MKDQGLFLLLSDVNEDDQVKEDEMGRTCSIHEVHTDLVGKPEGKRPPENLGVNGRIILNLLNRVGWLHLV
jgi:hypothetical protein